MKLLIHSQTSMVAPLKFLLCNWYSHLVIWIWPDISDYGFWPWVRCCLSSGWYPLSMLCQFCDKTISTLRLRQNGRHFPDDIFECIFFNEILSVSITSSLKFVPKGPVISVSALVQIMAWHCPGNKPLSEPMIVWFTQPLTWPHWVNICIINRTN